MKSWIVALILGLSAHAFAAEVEGVKLPEKIQVGQSTLSLNGAGLRSMFFMKIYVAALYLESTKKSAADVLADKGAKRIELHVVADDAPSERLAHGFRRGIEKNSSAAQLGALQSRVETLEKVFENVKTVVKGDVVQFDWTPGQGTRITLNGRELASIPGEDFYQALLSIWIGEKPVTDGLKQELLGG